MKVRLRVPPVDDPDFVVDVGHGEVAVLRLVGSADAAAQEPVATLFATLHAELLEKHAREVVVDLRSLDFMAAPCFKQFAIWLDRLQDLPVEHRYKLRFRVNPTITWQESSLRALSCFDTDLISIEQ